MNFDLDAIHQAAVTIARKGGDHTLTHFNTAVEVERKSDDSPVTIADRETEEVMREAIAEQFPDHGIIGEEDGRANESSSVQWILEPIDGTKSFIHGVPLYTTLTGEVMDDEPVVGAIYTPAQNGL